MAGKGAMKANVVGDTERVRTRSLSQGNFSREPAVKIHSMGNNISINEASASPTLTTPLPQIILEKTMQVPKISLFEIPEEEENGGEMKLEKVEIQQIIDMQDYLQVADGEKLNLLMFAINKMNTSWQYKLDKIQEALTLDEEGIFPRLQDCETNIDDHAERISVLEEENKKLQEDVDFLKGVIQVQDKKIVHLQTDAADAKARSMANNLLISGLTGDVDDEKCKEKCFQFLKEKVQVLIEEKDIVVAHRLGEKTGIQDRTMVVKVTNRIRHEIFKYTKNLKGVKMRKA